MCVRVHIQLIMNLPKPFLNLYIFQPGQAEK